MSCAALELPAAGDRRGARRRLQRRGEADRLDGPARASGDRRGGRPRRAPPAARASGEPHRRVPEPLGPRARRADCTRTREEGMMQRRIQLAAGVAVVSIASVVGTTALAGGGSEIRERLTGFQEVPVVSTGAEGKFRAEVRRDRIDYKLRWEDLEGTRHPGAHPPRPARRQRRHQRVAVRQPDRGPAADHPARGHADVSADESRDASRGPSPRPRWSARRVRGSVLRSSTSSCERSGPA